MAEPAPLVPEKPIVFIDTMNLCQAPPLDPLAQRRLRDPAWRGATVVPIKRLEAGE